jgi:hypothetical protein
MCLLYYCPRDRFGLGYTLGCLIRPGGSHHTYTRCKGLRHAVLLWSFIANLHSHSTHSPNRRRLSPIGRWRSISRHIRLLVEYLPTTRVQCRELLFVTQKAGTSSCQRKVRAGRQRACRSELAVASIIRLPSPLRTREGRIVGRQRESRRESVKCPGTYYLRGVCVCLCAMHKMLHL